MFGRGDLGFSPLFVAATVLVSVVICVVIRRRWRLAAARTEEIKRLLVLAAEESARAELEASGYYENPAVNIEYVAEQQQQKQQQVLPNQCAVCFLPTRKLCSQCKAVRYCSGKCQIIHWRQGHKEECGPRTIFDKSNEGKITSQKELSQQEHLTCADNNYELDSRPYSKQVKSFPQKYTDVGNPDVLYQKDGIEGEGLADDLQSNSSATSHLFDGSSESTTSSSESSLDASVDSLNDSDGLDRIQTGTGIPVKSKTVYGDMDHTRSEFAEKSCNVEKSSINSGKYKPVCSDRDCHCVSCISSDWSVDDSMDSLSEPSMPSSGFWEGTINSRRSRNCTSDNNCIGSSLRDSDGEVMRSPGKLRGFPAELAKNNTPAAPNRRFKDNTILSVDSVTASGTKRPDSEAAISVKLCKGDLKSMKSTSLNVETSKHMHVETRYNSRVLNSRDIRSSPSSNYCDHPKASDEGHLNTIDINNVSRSPSLCSERPEKVGNDTISSSRAFRSHEVGSVLRKDFAQGLTSSSGRCAGQTASLSKVNDSVHGFTACSSQSPTDSAKSTMLKVVDPLKPSKIPKHYSIGAGSETLGKCTVKGLFSYELFVKLYNWNKLLMQPCGLINCGNSCYANAVLQCLAFTPPITAYLLQRLHSKTCQSKDWCFACEFESLILKAKESKSPLSPIRILTHIENIGSHLGYGKEEDAHEFLRYAIDTLQSSCLQETTAKNSGSFNEETTLIGLTFGGYLRSKIQCMKCGGKSERHDRIMDLTVEIDGNICTLEDALREFTGTEILDDENKYNCSRCKSYEKAKKKLTILEAPNVLTIALKRFQSGKFGKLNKSVQFPEILNMTPFMSSTSDKAPVYQLYGVVVHLDTMNASFSGHYICYVKNIQNKWFKIDDSVVNAVELESVLTKGAYMLFYARCSPRAPKLIRNLIVPDDPRKPKNPSLKSRSHSSGPCDPPSTYTMNYQTREGFYQNHPNFHRVSSNLEDDSSSDNSSSIFSEACSSSTDSSTKDSMSSDDYVDQIFGDSGHIFGDSGHNWNNSWWNSSDSDTSSPSPSRMHSKNKPPTNSDHYVSYSEASHYPAYPAESAGDGHFWAKQPSKVSTGESMKAKGSVPILCSDKSKQCRNIGCNCSSSSSSSSSYCRETNSDRLGTLNSVNSGISLRRYSRGRLD